MSLLAPQAILSTEHLDMLPLVFAKSFAVALVQDFDVALRSPGRKEHVRSINWRVANDRIMTRDRNEKWQATQNNVDPVGCTAWALFTRSE